MKDAIYYPILLIPISVLVAIAFLTHNSAFILFSMFWAVVWLFTYPYVKSMLNKKEPAGETKP